MPAARTLEQIVDRQARRWEVERRATAPRPRSPCVAISRLPHSGAAQVGQRVAEWLDYGFFGQEIVDWIAREQGVQRQLVAGLDEHVRNAIDRYVADAFRGRSFNESDYLRHVIRTVATLGERGMAVILGRGATFILAPEQALRVLVFAPRSTRLERLSRARGLSAEQAAQRLARDDADRRDFVRRNFGVEYTDSTLYDVCINTGTMSVEGAAAIVVDALRRRFPTVRDSRQGAA